ncbi:hypothetical protein AVEN_119325-1 [Araneus ventricosus]|uniref:Inorganic phosphate cotransporter n=1 Tax=Araneus ventricosus TaxID=182803 RepID=A0A4Y2QEP8_ARAVE|nr:hypothetical protein AVEN_119325-1 [Araneus ventricosus]
MTKNGLSSCGPVLMKSIGGVVASILSTWLTKKNYVGVDKLRKGFTLLGAFGFASCMLGMGVAGCNATISILFFSISLFTSGLALSGVMISGMDMAPVHAGSLMGIACTIAGLSTLIIPVLTGFLTTHETLSEWKNVFWISSAIVGLSGIVYVVFGSAEAQSWNYPDGKVPEQEVDVKGKQMVEDKSADA